MAKYRPIDVRLWNDRKFLSLGDDARLLWLFLLTAPSTLPIPGVIVAGHAAIAEHLGWSAERLAKRFAELFQSGLAVSREGSLVWLRNALKYQPPANPNVMIGWSKVWDDVPEGSLKHDLWAALKTSCKSWSGIFAKRFPEPLQKPFENRSDNGSANGFIQDQDQDQDQKQDQDQDLVPPPADATDSTGLRLLKDRVDRSTPKLPRKGPLPSDWEPREQERVYALGLGVDCDAAARRFRNNALAKGLRYVQWDRAFENWITSAKEFGQDLIGGPRRGAQTGFDAVLDIANGRTQ